MPAAVGTTPQGKVDAAGQADLGAAGPQMLQTAGGHGFQLSFAVEPNAHHPQGVDLHDLKVDSPEVAANIMDVVQELTLLERIGFENDLLFGTSPVIRRDARRVRARQQEREEE